MVRIVVIDGQGGGIGYQVILALRGDLPDEVEIIALGTNAVATQNMMRAKANKGATGENAIVRTAPKADIIIGTLGILAANSMLGELTPAMAEAIGSSDAVKLLLPHNQSQIEVVTVVSKPLPHALEDLVKRVREIYAEREGNDHV